MRLFQESVGRWAVHAFGEAKAGDLATRRHRFVEEALELLQAMGGTREEALELVDYVFGRATGDRLNEVGGVLTTLAALCEATGISMEAAAERERDRCWLRTEQIRRKDANKPEFQAAPGPVS